MPEVEGLPILEHRDAGIVGRLALPTDNNIPPHDPTSPVQLSGPTEIRHPGRAGQLQDSNLAIEESTGIVGSVGSEHASEFNCAKNGVGRLAPPTDDGIPPYTLTLPFQLSGTAKIRPISGIGRLQDSLTNKSSGVSENAAVDWREITLGMPLQNVIKLWQLAGAPMIHMGPGENCEDLNTLLSDPDTSTKHIEVIRKWLVQQPNPIHDKK